MFGKVCVYANIFFLKYFSLFSKIDTLSHKLAAITKMISRLRLLICVDSLFELDLVD